MQNYTWCYPYIDEQYVLYHTTDGRTINYQQHGFRFKNQEKIIFDNLPGFNSYPFNTQSSTNIKYIEMKLNNVEMNISKNEIICNKPICIEVCVDRLYIWNTEIEENRSLTTKGGSIIDGYNLLCFDGTRKKVNYNFNYTKWNLSNLYLSSFILKGNNSNITINGECFDSNCILKLYGKNNIKITPKNFDFLELYSTHNYIDLTYSNVNNINIEMEGNGTINGLKVNNNGNIKLVGNGNIYLKSDEKTNIEKKIYGIGKIILI